MRAAHLSALARLGQVEAVLSLDACDEDIELDAVSLFHDDHVRAQVQDAGARVVAHRVRHAGVAAPEPAAKEVDPSAAAKHLDR